MSIEQDPRNELNVSTITWPSDPYGFLHARETSQLAVRIGQTLGLTGEELLLCRAAAMYHDTARSAPWWNSAPDHRRLSAEIACDALSRDRNWRPYPALIERACIIIARHNLDGRPPTSDDPIAQALWDADSLEAARLAPGEPEGEKIVAKRYARLVTSWGRFHEHQERVRERYRQGFQTGRPDQGFERRPARR